ncbi:MAG TPA: glycosyltransferase family A protein [Pseudolabrys sp.]|nr:glycosyltransferase family A protein [Pseudolabrys sp.]
MTEVITATGGHQRASTPTAPSPAVSIVVPCFNGGRFLDGLMASLARQSFRDFEIIIVDDGSSDPQTLRKLSALNGSATVIRQMNRGPAAARNTGIRGAKADIIFALDCDDTIEPGFLAETVPLLRASPSDVGMVFSDLRLTGAETGLVSRYFNRFDLLFTNTLSSGLVMRRDAWLAAGGYDEAMRSGYEDWDFSLRLARADFRGLRVAKPLYVYHIADDAAPSRSTEIDTKRLYGGLWRHIRERHAQSYTTAEMLRLWRASRDGSSRVPLWKGLAACALARVLPDAAFNLLIARLHRRPRADAARMPVGLSLLGTTGRRQ